MTTVGDASIVPCTMASYTSRRVYNSARSTIYGTLAFRMGILRTSVTMVTEEGLVRLVALLCHPYRAYHYTVER